jgi:hypothetical protein
VFTAALLPMVGLIRDRRAVLTISARVAVTGVAAPLRCKLFSPRAVACVTRLRGTEDGTGSVRAAGGCPARGAAP